MKKYKFEYGLDHPLRSIEHKKILKNKKYLRNLYVEWYNIFKSHIKDEGTYLELGSGGGFIKEIIPGIITSDINEIPGIDKFFSAAKMPFEDNSLSGIFMIDSFHHFPNVDEFFNEALRTLKKGGKIIMIEPWNTNWSKFVYKKFHHELFDPERDWTFPLKGPLSGSNMALPYIVFKRDIHIFKKKYPDFKLIDIVPHTPFTYIISGGFSRKSFLPDFTYKFVRSIENNFSCLRNNFAMFASIEIEKA